MPGGRAGAGPPVRRSTGDQAGTAQLLQKAADRQALVDAVAGKRFATRADRGRSRLQYASGQRNVLGDDQVACGHPCGNGIVGRVRASRHLQRSHVGQARGGQEMIGDQRHRRAGAGGSAEKNVADDCGAGIGIDPDMRAGRQGRRIHVLKSTGKGPDRWSDSA
ncbi:hypothetical protein XPR_2110 [Xanthomonas arboricola pv. pruni MAFF 301420]|uniref:C2H2-type domain-containing protein n=2 Tax=Xanthomonas arboricola pv. pruni TaxID=69929 RepID=W4SFY0_9XANT|nr:hypothetical protein XPU_4635 [Xanthomonas arboricola pv. pruni str. MAFF 311562]GAE55475.1 hypothetical protein XPR_2110 [Xanthomonas arboricola pv. pruni MAFF 301420]GAE60648.1 hypothetical protein XPN_2554 [Xanthomonas arboricola pv. pruni MAFF 301427]